MKILHGAKKGKNIFTEETVDWQLNETKNITVKKSLKIGIESSAEPQAGNTICAKCPESHLFPFPFHCLLGP